MTPLVAITRDPLDLPALTRALDAAAPGGVRGDGAVTSFAGLVRNSNQGRQVSFLDYEAYEPLAIRALNRIIDEAREAWPDARLAVHHRIGRLELGEASIIIVAASPHRAAAFAACRYMIERVKQIVPIWKHEHFEGGDVWLEGATADPTDEAARQEVLHRMRVTVRLFARLRDLAGSGELVREIPGPATVHTVWKSLVDEMPGLSDYERTMSVAVNADYSKMSAAVQEGDEVAFLPPVSGG